MELTKKQAKGEAGEALDTAGPRSLFRREVERALDRAWGAFEGARLGAFGELDVPEWPAMDVSEDDKAVTYRVDVPGLGPKDVEIEVAGDRLSIRGTRREERTENDGGRRRRERFVGSFARTVTLPPYADGEKVEASYDKGVLTVTAPKVPGRGPRRVAVKAS
jgi:HSP20 family molecular chaperone IbpA